MKMLVAFLSLALVCVTLLGWTMLTESRVKIDELAPKLLAAEGAASRGTADAADLGARLQSANAEVEKNLRLVSELQARNETLRLEKAVTASRAEGLEAEVVGLRARLSDANRSTEKSTRENEILTHILNRRTAIAKTWTEDVSSALQRVGAAELDLVKKPSAVSHASLKQALDAARSLLQTTESAVSDLRGYIEKHRTIVDAKAPGFDDAMVLMERTAADVSRTAGILEASLKSFRQSKFVVMADQEWQTSEIDFVAGEEVVLVTTGVWRWAPRIGNAVSWAGENGDVSYRLATEAGNGALLTRVRGGKGGAIGSGHLRPDAEGKLEFRINDTHVGDNSGSLSVTFFAFRPLKR